ncbi:hypothetical protein dsx2_2471 [Desulfovibrio sp. X2]|uniref:hypothetical protein n=1 Tax=Desulfovibrio sp. X2 TaxID=941449 RepID=UPI000358CEF1|nr:hypothetical protein [Desulfovibrio sp. X2]EPR43111.1 hypothetical protein dsx2_2471 [Desulfovibrio sp. X2]
MHDSPDAHGAPRAERIPRLVALAWFFLSLGGLLLHLRLHPPSEALAHWVPFITALINTLVLPWLFLRRETAPWGCLAAWFTVILGSTAMAWTAAVSWQGPVTAQTVILKSTLPDILILWTKLPLAHVAVIAQRPEGPPKSQRGCRA